MRAPHLFPRESHNRFERIQAEQRLANFSECCLERVHSVQTGFPSLGDACLATGICHGWSSQAAIWSLSELLVHFTQAETLSQCLSDICPENNQSTKAVTSLSTTRWKHCFVVNQSSDNPPVFMFSTEETEPLPKLHFRNYSFAIQRVSSIKKNTHTICWLCA